MLKHSYYYTIKQYKKMGLKVGYKIRGKKTGFTIEDNKGKTLFILYDRYKLEDKMLDLKHKLKHKKRSYKKMIKYLIELNEDTENTLTMEELEEIENKGIKELKDEYNECYHKHLENDYMLFIETVIYQLQRNQPIISDYTELKQEVLSELEKTEENNDWELIEKYDELDTTVLQDTLLIENLFYEELMYELPIKYYTDHIALRTETNDFLDMLNKLGRISDFTVENIDYNITPTDITKIK